MKPLVLFIVGLLTLSETVTTSVAQVHNPIAVPYLTKALESNPMVSSIVIPALKRFDDKR